VPGTPQCGTVAKLGSGDRQTWNQYGQPCISFFGKALCGIMDVRLVRRAVRCQLALARRSHKELEDLLLLMHCFRSQPRLVLSFK